MKIVEKFKLQNGLFWLWQKELKAGKTQLVHDDCVVLMVPGNALTIIRMSKSPLSSCHCQLSIPAARRGLLSSASSSFKYTTKNSICFKTSHRPYYRKMSLVEKKLLTQWKFNTYESVFRLFRTFFRNCHQIKLAKPWVFQKKNPKVFPKIPWVYSKE